LTIDYWEERPWPRFAFGHATQPIFNFQRALLPLHEHAQTVRKMATDGTDLKTQMSDKHCYLKYLEKMKFFLFFPEFCKKDLRESFDVDIFY
jgi:hypothetical protein